MSGKPTHITEIMPSDMPQWMWDAIDEGLLARRCMEKVAGLETQLESMEGPAGRLASWCRAYPPQCFIEVKKPDWKKADKVLADAGISMTAMNASNMRHVIAGVAEIAKDLEAALYPEPANKTQEQKHE